MAIMESAATWAFDFGSSSRSWVEEFGLSLEAELLSMDDSGDHPSSSGSSRISQAFQFGGDITMDDFLDPGLPAHVPRPGEDELVEAESLLFDGGGDASLSDSSGIDSHFQFGGDIALDDYDLDQYWGLHPASCPGEDELVGAESLLSDGRGEASPSDSSGNSYSQLGGDIALGDYDLDQYWGLQPAPCPAGGEIHMQLVGTTPDSAMEEPVQIADVAVQVRSAGRRWPVLAPSESIGIDKRGNGTWEAHIWLKDFNIDRPKKKKNGMQFFLGSFTCEGDAKKAHDKAAIMLDARVSKTGTLYSLNYPEEQYADYIAAYANWSRRDYMWKMRRESEKFSKGACSLKGVGGRKTHGKGDRVPGYTASISVTTEIDEVKRKTTMTVGHFETADEAGREYDKALLFIKGMYDPGCITNFPPGSYSAAEVQEVGQKLTRAYPKVNFKELKRKHSGLFA